MPENDEPLDDARAVAMNAAAAAARVAETVIRDQQDRSRRQPQEAPAVGAWGNRPIVQAYADHDGLAPNERQDPRPWDPRNLTREQLQEDERQIRKHNETRLPTEPASETFPSGSGYDSPSRRAAADAEMAAAGVPAEVRNARSVSDVLNGQDPARAAAAGSKALSKAKGLTRRPERQRGR